jgi:mono/diheme cytochrome c family protein
MTKFIIPILITLIISCGTPKRSEPITGKMQIKSEAVANGKIVFINNCQKCHPGGEAGVGPGINNVPIPGILKRFRVRSKAFLLGLGRMPSFKKDKISGKEMNDLVAYLKALNKNKKNKKE